MDVFLRTFLPAAAGAGVAAPTVNRHLPFLRNCVAASDAALLVTRCDRVGVPVGGDHLFLLTRRRLVVTQQTRLLRRLRLHLNAELRHLSSVTWSPDPRHSTIEVAVTAIDGVRERFLLRAAEQWRVRELDALLSYAFIGAGQVQPMPVVAR